MKLSYKGRGSGILINDFISCLSFGVGESIICTDDNHTMNITKYKTYKALYIYEADIPNSNEQSMFVQIADDGNEISGYEIERFISIKDHRELQLSKILD